MTFQGRDIPIQPCASYRTWAPAPTGLIDSHPKTRTISKVFSAFVRMALLLGFLSAIGPFANHMYLPALPDISLNLGVSPGKVSGA